MNKRIIAFAIYAIGLIGFPIWMIVQENQTFNEGHAYKFKCAPVDPNDPFRGKYIRLRFEDIEIPDSLNSYADKQVFGQVAVDGNGYAYISSFDSLRRKNIPSIELEKTQRRGILSISKGRSTRYRLPFDRLYMNEDKAQAAEDLYRNALRDSTQNVYAKVFINADRYLLDNVYIDDIPLSETIE